MNLLSKNAFQISVSVFDTNLLNLHTSREAPLQELLDSVGKHLGQLRPEI